MILKKALLFCLLSGPIILAAPPQHAQEDPHEDVQTFDSVFVPLDSWIYPALYRLSGMGYIPDQFSNMAPWTRDECARQVDEASDILQHHVDAGESMAADQQAAKIIADLRHEINDMRGPDDGGIRLESVYTAVTGIKGLPLEDSYHFGQTVVNDYGRPLWKGINNDTGASIYANFQRVFIYLRGEYQNTAGSPNYTNATKEFIALADVNPPLPGAVKAVSRFQPEEMYIGYQLGNENISFGRENLWWGPGQDSAFAFSDNADPFYMLNFDQTRPIILPGVFRHFGRIRTQFVLGELSGHLFPRHTLVNAAKISFDLTNNLEVGFTGSVFWGGDGHPVTFGSFYNSIFSLGSTGCNVSVYGSRCSNGDGHTGFDFRWRVKGLEKYLTIYSDSYSEDQPSPLASPTRSTWGPGIYISQLPGLPKIDLRLESYSSWPYQGYGSPQFTFWNTQYHDSYTNDGYMLGSWIGRDARSYVATADYWVSGRSKIQAQFRQTKISPGFLYGGGTQSDGSLMIQWGITPELLVSVTGQYERYDIPVLGPVQHDKLGQLSITYTPRNLFIQ
jgi:hypothetical protein